MSSHVRQETIAVVTLLDVEYDGTKDGAREAVLKDACKSIFVDIVGGSIQYGGFSIKAKHTRLDAAGD